ncbi:hypothetical protein QC763_606650 [Podospora pseudopauciseta]|uniref:DUF7730 domain-containing protein n=2 Tax=Podospora TaxID=5144 RepID=A0ABR0H5B5_9PEZI|nr:hypothetical protein QC763_606650 [Podospora pseudopauciseta]KAK4671527.1 hypothetical protein QC764_606650 [Podospora pseudoanserina]
MRRQETPEQTQDTMVATTLAQDDSPFFSLLPPEIRELIYQDIWSESGSRQHIYKDNDTWSHVPCVADYSTGDTRFEKFTQSARGSQEEYYWVKRLKSEWCYHWCCEQSTAKWHRAQNPNDSWKEENVGHAGPSGFMNPMLVCKRMYREALPSLVANTTFVFTDLLEAHGWLSLYGGNPEKLPIRSLEICILTTQLMTELYFPTSEENEGPNPTFGHGNSSNGRSEDSHPGITMHSNPWQRVCDQLALLPNLHSLHIWFHTRDLRDWHKRMSETRFFAKLFNVKVKDRNQFVLALPDLPLKPKRGLPSHHFFENETLEGAPFVVERGPRPNNWRVHLMASGLRGP